MQDLNLLSVLLKSAFDDVRGQPLPDSFSDLLDRLREAEEDRDALRTPAPPRALPDHEFKKELARLIPQLRAFGRSLSGSADKADDLVQETLLKAWAARDRFQAGTSMRAWTFMILRNYFLSQARRVRFTGEWDDATADRLLCGPASQDKRIELDDVQRALMELPHGQREALVLVGAGGFAYEEAAAICNCAVGTIKSRVARGRAALETILTEGRLPSRRAATGTNGETIEAILTEADTRLPVSL